ncbi:MAG: cupin domain-containing protein [Bauldia sp.]|nr:cupin domain-containing protein [Bauldia sp.]
MNRALVLVPLAVVGAAAAVAFAQAPDNAYQNLLTPVLASGETILGQPIAYPEGTPLVTAAIVTIPPGGETGWHTHSVPLFAYILEGALTVDYGSEGTRVYAAGGGVLEAMDWAHNGTNRGDAPVRLLAVYMGVEGTANADPATTPGGER